MSMLLNWLKNVIICLFSLKKNGIEDPSPNPDFLFYEYSFLSFTTDI